MADLMDAPPVPVEAMHERLRELLATVQNPICGGSSTASSRTTPRSSSAGPTRPRPSTTTRPTSTACSSTASPSRRAFTRSRHVPGRRPRRGGHGRAAPRHREDRGVRDIGRRDRAERRGKLQGEIPLGYYLVRREIEELPGVRAGDGSGGAAHHPVARRPAGAGSPVVPCTREATLVHMIDNLGGRLARSTGSRSRSARVSAGRASTGR